MENATATQDTRSEILFSKGDSVPANSHLIEIFNKISPGHLLELLQERGHGFGTGMERIIRSHKFDFEKIDGIKLKPVGQFSTAESSLEAVILFLLWKERQKEIVYVVKLDGKGMGKTVIIRRDVLYTKEDGGTANKDFYCQLET